jgi:hypothetical protein
MLPRVPIRRRFVVTSVLPALSPGFMAVQISNGWVWRSLQASQDSGLLAGSVLVSFEKEIGKP